MTAITARVAGVQHVVVATVQWWTYHMENEALLSKVLLPFDARVADSHARARAYYEEQRPHFEDAARRFHLHQHFVETARNFSAKDTTYYDLSEKRLRAMAQLLRSNGRDDFLIEKSKRAPHVAHGGTSDEEQQVGWREYAFVPGCETRRPPRGEA